MLLFLCIYFFLSLTYAFGVFVGVFRVFSGMNRIMKGGWWRFTTRSICIFRSVRRRDVDSTRLDELQATDFFFFIYFDIHIYCLHRYLMYQVDLLIIIISSVCGSVLYENLKGSRSFQLTICWRDYISIYFQKCVLTNLKKLFSHFNENQPLSLAWSFTLVSCYRIAVVTIWFLVLL